MRSLLILGLLAGGALLALLVYAGDAVLGLWMAPVALALLSSPAQSVLTSSTRLGLGSKARRLFLTEDDTRPAPELLELHQARAPGAPTALSGEPTSWLPTAIDKAGAPTLR